MLIHREVLDLVDWAGHLELTGLETLQVSLSPIYFLFCFFHVLASVIGKTPHSTTAGSQSLPRNAGSHPLILPNSHGWGHGHHHHHLHGHGPAATTTTSTTGNVVKKQGLLLTTENVQALQQVVWSSSSKFQMPSQEWHMQKIQHLQQQQHQPQSSQGTGYQKRQAVKGTEPPHSVLHGTRSFSTTWTGEK